MNNKPPPPDRSQNFADKSARIVKRSSKNEKGQGQGKDRVKKPRKITASYLRNSGLFYLQRFTASSEHFRFVMTRKIKKSCTFHTDQDYDECCEMLDRVVEDFKQQGLLNDADYVRGMVTSLRRAGKSRKAIFARLMQKRVAHHDIENALNAYDSEHNDGNSGDCSRDAELNAAIIFARKKRLGAFDAQQKHSFDKALGSMARAGFSFDIAKRVLEFTAEEIDEIRDHGAMFH